MVEPSHTVTISTNGNIGREIKYARLGQTDLWRFTGVMVREHVRLNHQHDVRTALTQLALNGCEKIVKAGTCTESEMQAEGRKSTGEQRTSVGFGAEQTLLFPREQDELDGAPECGASGLDPAGDVEDRDCP